MLTIFNFSLLWQLTALFTVLSLFNFILKLSLVNIILPLFIVFNLKAFYFSLISFLIIVLDLVDYFDIFVNFDLCWLIKVNSWSLFLVDSIHHFQFKSFLLSHFILYQHHTSYLRQDLHDLPLLELWNFRLWSLSSCYL